jgi:ArsR family transcriptional regulator
MITISSIFKSLSDPTRLRIVHLLLRGGELCVCEFEHLLDLPQPLVSRHLTSLKNAGLVKVRREAQWMYYSLVSDSVVLGALHEFLAAVLAGDPSLKRDIKALIASAKSPCKDIIKCKR